MTSYQTMVRISRYQPKLDVTTQDPDASASNPLPKPVHQTGFPSLTPPDGSAVAIPRLVPAAPPGQDPGMGFPHIPAGDQFVTLLTQTTAHARGNPHANSFTSVMEGLKEMCSMMMTGFQRACLDIEKRMLEEATQLNRDFTMAAAQDKLAAALQLVLDNGGGGCWILTWK